MHQMRRSPSNTDSQAQSTRTQPTRIDSLRDDYITARTPNSGNETPGPNDETTTNTSTGSEEKDPIVQRLNQTIQNLYCKGILVILQDRLDLPPAYKKTTKQLRINKWFGLDVTESDSLLSDYATWKNLDISNNQPPTMILDILIRSRDLKGNETLVMDDEFGKMIYVDDAVRNYHQSLHIQPSSDYDIVLERWHFDLSTFNNEFEPNLVSVLPKMYKNAVVLFRALYAMLHLLPAWKLSKKYHASVSAKDSPTLSYRVYPRTEHTFGQDRDGLTIPLPDLRSQGLDEYEFETLDTPAGKFKIKVIHRQNCDFRIEKSEALISSRINESDLFRPSLRRQSDEFDRKRQDLMPPPAKTSRQILREVDQAQQAYGSLSTYHLAGHPLSSSPLSTLRAARDLHGTSPRNSPPGRPAIEPRTSQESHGSLRSDGPPPTPRRTSATFMPFKSPSLSASPSPLSGDRLPTPRIPSSVGSRSSALSALAEARHPGITQQTAQYTSALPTPIPTPSTTSPRPTPKYSSSFSHRRSRTSVSLSRDDDASSGQASPRPGSGTGEANTSSGSLNADDDNISDFLKMLDSKKDLKSFRSPDASTIVETSTRRTTVALSKFSKLRDSNAVLSDSMSLSVLGHRSSISSSRQLSSVPPMVAGTSLSPASSPGERMSPRTPHTPAIPSRLSANSIVEYNTHRERSAGSAARDVNPSDGQPQAIGIYGTGAIDIPNSPRVFQPGYRRSSSVAQQHRVIPFGEEDLAEMLPFGNRSTSLGGNGERVPLTLSQMLAIQDETGAAILTEPLAHQVPESAPMSRQISTNSQEDSGYNVESSSRGAYRPRGIGRGHRGPHGSSTSLAGERGSTSGGSDARGGRHSFQRSSHLDEDELLFAMSDFGVAQQGRQSIDDGRRTGSSGNDSIRRGVRPAGGTTTDDPQTWS